MATKQEFAMFAFRLKKAIPRFAPDMGDEDLMDAWYGAMGHLSTPELTQIFKTAVIKFSEFPAIKELLEVVGQSAQRPEDKAREVAERILSAISRFGQTTGSGESARKKLADVEEYIGPIGAEVVRLQGGWNQVCEITDNDNLATMKAQWRGSAENIARRGPTNMTRAPGFDLPPAMQDAMKKLTEGFNP